MSLRAQLLRTIGNNRGQDAESPVLHKMVLQTRTVQPKCPSHLYQEQRGEDRFKSFRETTGSSEGMKLEKGTMTQEDWQTLKQNCTSATGDDPKNEELGKEC